ncbi:VWA domain-containing protein [Sulfidibacter corallicola]|uniref:VWA domain-containing protein n=1 Tax=Sulfidibacter corallicola TaxID=2818388 RepID=A0A8A4TQJ6_SULCO|nr:VWA domain-containing protein [Sulfidibacter corallicola]QTD48815.1 VWA domain-containing protein [Sulfidibacter corallicola]
MMPCFSALLPYLFQVSLVFGGAACFGYMPNSGNDDLVLRVESEYEKVLEGPRSKVFIKVALDAPATATIRQRPDVNLALVLDRSGSMKGRKLREAKQGAVQAVYRLNPSDVFALVAYESTAQTLVPATRLDDMNSVLQAIEGIQIGQSTAIFAGVSLGAAEVRKNIGMSAVHRIVLLSDGIANVGPSSPEDMVRLGVALGKEGISVSTVGIGDDYNEDVMTALSQTSEGNTYYVKNVEELVGIFSRELGDVLSVYARDISVRVLFPKGVRPLSIVNHKGTIAGNEALVAINQLYGGQEKFLLFECEVLNATAGERRSIAEARVSYTHAGTKRSHHLTNSLAIRVTSSQNAVLASANTAVIRDNAVFQNTYVVDQAIQLADEGKEAQAVDELIKGSKALEQLGKINKDPALLKKSKEMESYAQSIEQRGMDKRTRKELRTTNVQEKTQQKILPKLPRSSVPDQPEKKDLPKKQQTQNQTPERKK